MGLHASPSAPIFGCPSLSTRLASWSSSHAHFGPPPTPILGDQPRTLGDHPALRGSPHHVQIWPGGCWWSPTIVQPCPLLAHILSTNVHDVSTNAHLATTLAHYLSSLAHYLPTIVHDSPSLAHTQDSGRPRNGFGCPRYAHYPSSLVHELSTLAQSCGQSLAFWTTTSAGWRRMVVRSEACFGRPTRTMSDQSCVLRQSTRLWR